MSKGDFHMIILLHPAYDEQYSNRQLKKHKQANRPKAEFGGYLEHESRHGVQTKLSDFQFTFWCCKRDAGIVAGCTDHWS